MKLAFIVEDEAGYIKLLEKSLKEFGYITKVVCPGRTTSADVVVSEITTANPDLILLDHDFCQCCFIHTPCKCLNGQDIFDRLGFLQHRVISISGIDRGYIPNIPWRRNFGFKDCLDLAEVRHNFEILVQNYAHYLQGTEVVT